MKSWTSSEGKGSLGPPVRLPPSARRRARASRSSMVLAGFLAREERVAEDLGQVADHARVVVLGEAGHLHVVGLGELEEQGHGQSAPVVLDVVQQALGDAEVLGHAALGQAARPAQAADLASDAGSGAHGEFSMGLF